MILVFGGSYQGKLDFIKNEFGIIEDEIYFCHIGEPFIDESKKVIYGLEKFILASIKENKSENEIIRYLNRFVDTNKILVCEDISQGIVPLEKEQRLWREVVGRSMVIFGKSAKKVYRVFCGLANEVK